MAWCPTVAALKSPRNRRTRNWRRERADPSVLFMVDFLQVSLSVGNGMLWGILWDDDGMYWYDLGMYVPLIKCG